VHKTKLELKREIDAYKASAARLENGDCDFVDVHDPSQ